MSIEKPTAYKERALAEKTASFNVRLKLETIEKLKQIGRETNHSVSHHVRQAVEEYLETWGEIEREEAVDTKGTDQDDK